MRILVPVDGSRFSMEGIKVASQYAKTKTAALFIMTVIPYLSDIDLELSVSERDLLSANMKRRGEEVIEKAKDLMESFGIGNIRTVLSTAASAGDEIVNFSEREKIDLIVIGSRGKGATARFFLGSVAAHVVLYSPSCVYVVREPCWA